MTNTEDAIVSIDPKSRHFPEVRFLAGIAATSDTARPSICGVYVWREGDHIALAATNSYVIAVMRMPYSGEFVGEAFVSSDTLKATTRKLSQSVNLTPDAGMPPAALNSKTILEALNSRPATVGHGESGIVRSVGVDNLAILNKASAVAQKLSTDSARIRIIGGAKSTQPCRVEMGGALADVDMALMPIRTYREA